MDTNELKFIPEESGVKLFEAEGVFTIGETASDPQPGDSHSAQ